MNAKPAKAAKPEFCFARFASFAFQSVYFGSGTVGTV